MKLSTILFLTLLLLITLFQKVKAKFLNGVFIITDDYKNDLRKREVDEEENETCGAYCITTTSTTTTDTSTTITTITTTSTAIDEGECDKNKPCPNEKYCCNKNKKCVPHGVFSNLNTDCFESDGCLNNCLDPILDTRTSTTIIPITTTTTTTNTTSTTTTSGNSTSSTTTSHILPTETARAKDRCGIIDNKNYGSCANGECCSKYGWCGVSEKYCGVDAGCQSEFGRCDGASQSSTPTSSTTSTTSGTSSSTTSRILPTETARAKDRCGIIDNKNYGSCANGECCSKYGWCGVTEAHCSANSGCQSEFGRCDGTSQSSTPTSSTTSTTSGTSSSTTSRILPTETARAKDRCGIIDNKNYGSCADGECCSKYGWCGVSEKYCGVDAGCQSEFGRCDGTSQSSTPTSSTTSTTSGTSSSTTSRILPTETARAKDRCGIIDNKNYGSCADGECCSKYGWCGVSEKYCGVDAGCQSEFGRCDGTSQSSTPTSSTTSTTSGTSSSTTSRILPTETARAKDRCGIIDNKNYGSCANGECCSKYGWCGVTEAHCSANSGCQSEFGRCDGTSQSSTPTSSTTSTTSGTSSSTTSRILPTETARAKDRCGIIDNKNYGSCANGECCSKYGWCGVTEAHCSANSGCQSEFGRCDGTSQSSTPTSSTTSTTSGTSSSTTSRILPTETARAKDRCGIIDNKNYGSCANGECCSKYGWCGVTEAHCSANSGCQSEFGRCDGTSQSSTPTSSTTSTTSGTSSSTTSRILPTETARAKDRCGIIDNKNYGSCANGECCSKYGWCGVTEAHCSVNSGCQSEFGRCNSSSDNPNNNNNNNNNENNENVNNNIRTSRTSRCGRRYGKCDKNQCCSKYGWCGTSESYCSVEAGCQSEFGRCGYSSDNTNDVNNTDENHYHPWQCGEGIGSCKPDYCCSKYGWCGRSISYCSRRRGCQSSFGSCW